MAKTSLQAPKPHSVSRFAHPFFGQTGDQQQLVAAAQTGLTNFHLDQLGRIPPVKGDSSMTLADIIGASGTQEIQQLGEIRFHALGDSGVNHATDAELVAEDMTTDFKASAGGLNPAFLFHLGDVVYGPGKESHYGERFYTPYKRYPGKIIAIAGNHDGEVKTPEDDPSLSAFLAHFCADHATVSPQASESGIFRENMTQPGVYWLLDAPFLRIIGLYSNKLENPGFLQGKTDKGAVNTAQLDWLKATLTKIAKNKTKKALLIATHHPPFSQSGHSGSTDMLKSIDDICNSTGVFPDAFFSAHAHNYQRYTRRIGGKQIPYYVLGTGGISTQKTPAATGQPADQSNQTTYDAALQAMGYLFVTVSATQFKTEFWQKGQEHTKPFDALTVDLHTHLLK
jgi:hypothetical protein